VTPSPPRRVLLLCSRRRRRRRRRRSSAASTTPFSFSWIARLGGDRFTLRALRELALRYTFLSTYTPFPSSAAQRNLEDTEDIDGKGVAENARSTQREEH